MAKQQFEKTHHPEVEWHKALNRAIHDPAFGSMTDGEILQFTEALYSPDQLHWLVDLFREAHERLGQQTPFDYLSDIVSGSAYPLSDWLLAMHELGRKVPQPLEQLTQFLKDSAAQTSQSKPEISLVEAVQSRK